MENSYEHDIKNIEKSRSTKIRMVLLKITLISLAATTGITLGRCSKSKKKDSEQDFDQWQQTYFENNPATSIKEESEIVIIDGKKYNKITNYFIPIVLHSKDGSVIYAAPCMDAHVKATGPNSFICYTETLEPLEEELTLTKGY